MNNDYKCPTCNSYNDFDYEVMGYQPCYACDDKARGSAAADAAYAEGRMAAELMKRNSSDGEGNIGDITPEDYEKIVKTLCDMFPSGVQATSEARKQEPIPLEKRCHRCEENEKAENDYLCERCRFGI